MLVTAVTAAAAARTVGKGEARRGPAVVGQVGLLGLVRVASVCQVDVMMRGPPSFGHVGDACDHIVVIVPDAFAHLAVQQAAEGVVEVTVEEEVEHGVHHGIDVAQPQRHHPGNVGDAVAHDGVDDVHDEEGEPAHAEAAHDDAQRLGRLGLVVELLAFAVAHVVVVARLLQRADLVRLLVGRQVDLHVAHAHEDDGDVEGDERADDGEGDIDNEDADGGAGREGAVEVVLDAELVPAVHDGQEGDEDGRHPAEHQHARDHPHR